MPFDPDTEIQYRRGGKIMKKSPRKFNTGGAATPAPATKPAPKRATTPSDQPDAKTAAEMRRQAAEAKMDEGQRKAAEDFYSDKQRLGNKMKKGGKVRKFNEGGDVTQDTRERRADEKDTPRSVPAPIENRTLPKSELKSEDFDRRKSPETDWPSSTKPAESKSAETTSRFDPDTVNRAKNYANRLLTPDGKDETGGKARTGLKEPPKAAPRAAPKAAKTTPKKEAPKKEAPKKESLSDYGESNDPGKANETLPPMPPASKFISRGRNYSSTGEMSPQAEKLVGDAGAVAATFVPPLAAMRALKTAQGAYNAGRALTAAKNAKNERAYERALAEKRAPRNRDESQFADDGNPNFKRGGVAKYAKGGGVEAKGKTKGKIVKMAAGGSVRGYGVSKVTNKTKYC